MRNFNLPPTVRALVCSFGVLVSAFSSASSIASSNVSEWLHVPTLQSHDVSVQIDFQRIYTRGIDPWSPRPAQGPESFTLTAWPVWVNVHRNGLSAKDHVRVKVTQYSTSRYRGQDSGVWKVSDAREATLSFADPGHFAGKLPSLAFFQQVNDGYALSVYSTRQQIEIWVNGQAYGDPATGQGLSFNLSEAKKE